MIFFIDFDRTILNFDCFSKLVLLNEPTLKSFAEKADAFLPGSPERVQIWNDMSEAVDRDEAFFPKVDLSSCLFEDVSTFFKKHGRDIVIVTYGRENFQRFKVEGSLRSLSFKEVLYVETEKGPAIKSWLDGNKDEALFIDDTVSNLESVEKECPWITLYEMRRDGEEGSGKYPALKSLNELKI